MKFSELPYERVNMEETVKKAEALTEAFQNSTTFEEQLELIKEMDALQNDIYSMINLAYIRYTINTGDAFYASEREYNDSNSPLLHTAFQKFEKAMAESVFRERLIEEIGELAFDKIDFSLKSFKPELTELLQEESRLKSQYQKLMGSAEIPFHGEILNISQIGKYQQSNDRTVRKEAFEALGQFYDSIHKELDKIFDLMVKSRTKQAKMLGYDSFVELAYLRQERCYDKEAVQNFRRQVVEELVPVVTTLKEQQTKRIGVEKLFYYDDGCKFADGNPTPKGTASDLLAAGRKMYTEMSPITKEFIDFMFENDLFDVIAKPGKTTGGYCHSIPKYKMPFIFSNFNGTSGDVEVLTHEAGHALAYYRAVRELPFQMSHDPTMEACETHSMSMEFFAEPWYPLFFQEETAKYAYAHLEGTLSFIPYGCMVDHFQEIIYSNPDMTPSERNNTWLELEQIYRPYLDTTGLPFYSEGAVWQRQLHIYTSPFYYIDYCLAQTVALQFFMEIQNDWDSAWEKYNAFLAQGGKKNFLNLLKDANLMSPMEDGCLKMIAQAARKWLEEHPLD